MFRVNSAKSLECTCYEHDSWVKTVTLSIFFLKKTLATKSDFCKQPYYITLRRKTDNLLWYKSNTVQFTACTESRRPWLDYAARPTGGSYPTCAQNTALLTITYIRFNPNTILSFSTIRRQKLQVVFLFSLPVLKRHLKNWCFHHIQTALEIGLLYWNSWKLRKY